MNKRDFKTSYIIASFFLVTLTIMNFTWGLGYLIGALLSYVIYYRNVRHCDALLKSQHASKGATFANFFGNFGLMALGLLIGALKPEYVNIFAVALGLLLLKTAVIINVVIHRKETVE